MRRSTPVAPLLAVLFAAPPAPAEGPIIDHAGRTCMVAGTFPRLEARIADPDGVSRARVQFRGEGGAVWYSVEMKRSGTVFTGVLPKPKPSLKAIEYSIEATDRKLHTRRTPEFMAEVVGKAARCDPEAMAEVVSTASIVVSAPPGAASVPPGFSSSGVTGASSGSAAGAAIGGVGLGASTIVGIVAGGAAIAGVAVAIAAGGGEGPTTTTAVTLPDCPACFAGTWQGLVTLTAVANPPLCGQRASSVGQTTSVAPVIFASDGTVTWPPQACAGCAGRVDAAGNLAIALPGDPTGSGSSCPAGQLVGRCATPTSCAGTGSQGGDQYTFTLARVGP